MLVNGEQVLEFSIDNGTMVIDTNNGFSGSFILDDYDFKPSGKSAIRMINKNGYELAFFQFYTAMNILELL